MLAGEALAHLRYFNPDSLSSTDETEQRLCDFVLALALAYNDITDTLAMLVHLMDVKPNIPKGISRTGGEVLGVNEHYYRILLLELHELLYLIGEKMKSHGSMFECNLYSNTLARLPVDERRHWQEIVAIACGESESGDLKRMLGIVRNTASGHYVWTSNLRRGFDIFREKYKSLGQEGAYASIGPSMKETRFFFADAAAQSFLASSISDPEEFAKDLKSLAENIRNGVWGFLIAFITQKAGKTEQSKYD